MSKYNIRITMQIEELQKKRDIVIDNVFKFLNQIIIVVMRKRHYFDSYKTYNYLKVEKRPTEIVKPNGLTFKIQSGSLKKNCRKMILQKDELVNVYF